jgi:hypothetical protein
MPRRESGSEWSGRSRTWTKTGSGNPSAPVTCSCDSSAHPVRLRKTGSTRPALTRRVSTQRPSSCRRAESDGSRLASADGRPGRAVLGGPMCCSRHVPRRRRRLGRPVESRPPESSPRQGFNPTIGRAEARRSGSSSASPRCSQCAVLPSLSPDVNAHGPPSGSGSNSSGCGGASAAGTGEVRRHRRGRRRTCGRSCNGRSWGRRRPPRSLPGGVAER